MISRKEYMMLSEEERKAVLLEGISDGVRDSAHKLMMLKKIAYMKNGIAPEDFDTALNKELEKEWESLKDKTPAEIAMIGLVDLLKDGRHMNDISEEETE